ncbi:MAG: site-2 protease family protein [Myxococcaceae bacterium]
MDSVALRPAQRPLLHLGLLVLTLGTTFEVFLADQTSGVWNRANILDGVAFSLSLVAILGSHEMGHYVLARRHGVDASLPYFIPLPHLGFGTLGAVIRIRSRIPTRNALVDIGAAGPLAGFVVAVLVLLWGYAHASVIDVPVVASVFPPHESAFGALRLVLAGQQPVVVGQSFGDNLLTLLIQRLLVGPLPTGKDVLANPYIVAGWFGCLVTTLNLFPIGQLDGGHLAFANLGRRAVGLGKVTALGLLGLVLFFNVSWLVWLLVASLVVGFRHPEVAQPEEPLDGRRLLICVACLVVLVLCLTPSPVQLLMASP